MDRHEDADSLPALTLFAEKVKMYGWCVNCSQFVATESGYVPLGAGGLDGDCPIVRQPLWVDLITDYFEIIVPCTEGVPGVFNDCNGAALTPAEVSVWTSWGLSLESYGVFTLSGATFTFLVYTVLAGLLLWQQRQSWLGLMISLALIVIPFAMFAGSRDFGAIHPNFGWPAVVAYIVGNGIMLLFLYLVPNGRFSPVGPISLC